MFKNFSSRMEGVSGSAIREIFKLLANPEVISFAGGNPSPETFPVEEIQRITSELLTGDGARKILQYGITEGYPPLIDTVVERSKERGVQTTKDEVLIITGAQQGIDLASKILLDPGDVVLVEAPTFLGALQIFSMYQARPIPLEMDDEGIMMDDLHAKIMAHKPKMIYLIPTFQNPTGKTLGLERRKRVAELAAKYNVIVVEDDPYCELRYSGEALPAIKSFDESGNIIFLQSFSKIIAPGLRVGSAIAPRHILQKLTIGKQSTDVHASNLSQAVVQQYIAEGHLPKHIDEMKKGYRRQLDAMMRVIENAFPKDIHHTVPQGGLFVWIELPEQIDANVLFERCIGRNVAFVPGTSFYCEGGHSNTLRLNFSASSPERIEKGMNILAEEIAKIL